MSKRIVPMKELKFKANKGKGKSIAEQRKRITRQKKKVEA